MNWRFLEPLRHNPGAYPLGFRPELEGLRGALQIGVLAAHIRIAWFPGFFVFMDIFFLMSGYLITSLLIKGWRREGRIAIGRFYLRRVLRLFPALYVMLAAYGIAALLVFEDVERQMLAVLAAGTYVSNWAHAFGADISFYIGHTWSLSIEEQFYLLWPLVLGLLLRRVGLDRRAVAIVVCTALAFAAWRTWLTLDGASIMRLYTGTDTRADALLIGCALGLALAQPGVRDNATVQCWVARLAVPALVVIVVAGWTLQWDMREMYAGGSLAMNLVSCALVAALVMPQRTLVHRLFSLAPLVSFGRISYSLYLWHFPVFNVMRWGLGLSDAWLVAAGVPLSILLAVASFLWIERPFLSVKDRMAESKQDGEPTAARPDRTGAASIGR
jgi:peptidoglycan/LPS O-acetylase OafA/YrhL